MHINTTIIGCLLLLLATGGYTHQVKAAEVTADKASLHTTSLAFPGADGYGKYTTGGRGGQVIYVTTLSDDGKQGSLRWALKQVGPRIILFKVGGVIALTKPLDISSGDVTIAGQTAPGDGICIKDYGVKIKADNVIVRYLRFRMGDQAGYQGDAFEGSNQDNIIIDHCTMSWSTDECASFYGNRNFTMQWCILSESLRQSVHAKGAHGYGAIWGGQQVSYHHNLLAHHDSRNPRFCGSRYSKRPDLEQVDFRNNVVYNWGTNSGYAGEGGRYNMINNYYKPGSATKPKVVGRIFSPSAQDPKEYQKQQSAGVWGIFWLSGNVMHGNDAVTRDNWLGFAPNLENGDYPGGDPAAIRLKQAFDVPSQSITHTASEAYHKVLQCAGASLVRDTVDKRIMREVATGTCTFVGSKSGIKGLIDTQTDVGGWPTYASGTAPADTDADGIPDEWEQRMGLDKANAADGNLYTLDTRYTNVEMYINSLVQHIGAE